MALAKTKVIPDYLLADPVAPEMIWETGSLGSPVLALRAIYRAAGVVELWEFATAIAGKETAVVDLQAPDNPHPANISAIVPGVCADCLFEALNVLRKIGGYGDFRAALALGEPVAERLLTAAGVKDYIGSQVG